MPSYTARREARGVRLQGRLPWDWRSDIARQVSSRHCFQPQCPVLQAGIASTGLPQTY